MSVESSSMRLFFYGSLRKGEDNYERFTTEWPEAMRDVATGCIRGFELVNLGTHCSIVPGRADATVVGDVFDVSEELFKSIEVLETGFDYRRQTVEVETGDGHKVTADVYGFARPDELTTKPRIKSGDWKRR
jgi:gamma-glutamylcyclotransferase (GGCT)/AIG2-like uncharacterized protein YtfP